MISFDFNKYIGKYVTSAEKYKYEDKTSEIKRKFTVGDLSYWLNMDTYITTNELSKIFSVSEYIRENCDIFVVIGIGGSYMGAKAVIEDILPTYNRKSPEVIFLGNNLSSEEYNELFEYIEDKSVMINVISKSGTTLEPSIAFDLMLNMMEKKYNDVELKQRIYITTDPKEGYLRDLVHEMGYTSFDVPTNVGGRFSCITAVGLLPMAVAGVDITKLIDGVKIGFGMLDEAIEYSTIRDILYSKGKVIESFTVYTGKMYYFTEWLKQLFAETQGKDGKGILPISTINTRDLHSLGQYLQEGSAIIFETVIGVNKEKYVFVDTYERDLHNINTLALSKVAEAHLNGHTPSNIIKIESNNEYHLGALIQFFILSSIIGALLIEVNPFNQPGVQEYKKLIMEELSKE